MPGREKLPSTLKRSPPPAQRVYEKTLEHAEQEYGDGERAHRTALAVLEVAFEKVGNELGVGGSSRMSEGQLAKAIAKKQ